MIRRGSNTTPLATQVLIRTAWEVSKIPLVVEVLVAHSEDLVVPLEVEVDSRADSRCILKTSSSS